METLFVWYIVGPGHRLVLIQTQTQAWADLTCVSDIKYHGKQWDSGLLEAKPNPEVSMTLHTSRNLSLHLIQVQTQVLTQCANKQYGLLLFTYP